MRAVGDLMTPQALQDISVMPFCEFVHVSFTYGTEGREYTIEIPFEAFNKSVSSPEFALPAAFPVSDQVPVYYIELPACDLRWVDALNQFAKYLCPPHRNHRRVTNSPIIPAMLTSKNCLPLYLISRCCHFDGLANHIAERISAITHLVA
jgi:hypothetical protein